MGVGEFSERRSWRRTIYNDIKQTIDIQRKENKMDFLVKIPSSGFNLYV